MSREYFTKVATPRTFRANFGRTDNEAVDAELTRLQDQLHTIEQIQAICRQYKVRARVFDASTGRIVGDLDREGHEVTPRS
jgi:hypothetical protein